MSAHNVHGWGAVSSVVSIQAAAVPGTPNQVVTSIINRSARIAWSEPSTNYKTITKYQIEIKNLAAGTYHTELTSCDGTSSSIVSLKYCEVELSIL